jgi:hypothetical protein
MIGGLGVQHPPAWSFLSFIAERGEDPLFDNVYAPLPSRLAGSLVLLPRSCCPPKLGIGSGLRTDKILIQAHHLHTTYTPCAIMTLSFA